MKRPLVLVDDPLENDLFDLRRLLAGRGPCTLVGVATPIPGPTVAADTTPARAAIAAASAVTSGAPTPLPGYRLVAVRDKRAAERTFEVQDAVAVLADLAPGRAVVVAFVSPATLPVLEALHADPRTRPWLKLGVTGAHLDRNYNIARKLVYDGKLAYHEHSNALDGVLIQRLELMLRSYTAPAAAPAPEPEAAPKPPEAPAAAAAASPEPASPEAVAPPGATSS
jgi:hypothetical protein